MSLSAQMRSEIARRAAATRRENRGAPAKRRAVDASRSAAARRAWDTMNERIDAVRRDLADDPLALAYFENVKHRLRISDHATLTEVFQQYMHDHPAELATVYRQWETPVVEEESEDEYLARLGDVPF